MECDRILKLIQSSKEAFLTVEDALTSILMLNTRLEIGCTLNPTITFIQSLGGDMANSWMMVTAS
jgi:hypothetical protein